MKRILPLIATAALFSCAALAEEAPDASGAPAPAATAALHPSDLRKVEKDDQVIASWNLKVDDIEDRHVYGANGEELGEIEAVLEDSAGQVKAVVVEFGGFLGFGEKEVIVAIDQLQPGDKRFTTALTKEQLENLPAWKG